MAELPKWRNWMKLAQRIAPLVVLGLLSVPAVGKGNAVLNVSCKVAISQAELVAANHKWSPQRPDPSSPILNITTSMNYTKAIVLGPMFSHPKTGELIFDESRGANVCEVTSNGHPADVVLKDLETKFSLREQPVPPPATNTPTPVSGAGVQPTKVQPVTNSDVLALVKAGLPAEVITAKIQNSLDAFDTSVTALAQLKTDGVPDAVILAMVKAVSKAAPPKQ